MHLNRKHINAGGNAARRGSRPAAFRSSKPPLELVRSKVESGCLTAAAGPADPAVGECRQLAAGPLMIRSERRDDVSILWLSGVLGRATASSLDRELKARTVGVVRLVVDLTGLDSIDSPGLDSLAWILRRACARGVRMSFRHGLHAWAPHPVGVGDEDFYFAIAMACVGVDHPRQLHC
jgi:ABC-type transporter Mla MlaB component